MIVVVARSMRHKQEFVVEVVVCDEAEKITVLCEVSSGCRKVRGFGRKLELGNDRLTPVLAEIVECLTNPDSKSLEVNRLSHDFESLDHSH